MGIDWAESFHDVALGSLAEGVIELFRIEHRRAGVTRLVARYVELEPEPAEVRVVLETQPPMRLTAGRYRGGTEFGLDQFTGFIIWATAAGELASEQLRLLFQALLDRQEHEPRDDAAIMLLEWRPSRSRPLSSRR